MATTVQMTAPPPGTIAPTDPKTGQMLYHIAEPDDAAIDAAYARAQAAFEKIRAMTVGERLQEIKKLRHYIRKNRERIIDRVCQENGKTRYEALITEIFSVLESMIYYEKNAAKMLRDKPLPTPLLLLGKKGKIVYEPMGVVLVIMPWNFPFNQAIQPFLDAFIAGNSVVYKPSEYTPMQGLLEEIFEKSGFMKDAFTVVYGGKETGGKLIDRRPKKIFFTGSTAAGRAIMAHAARYLIPVELELGGKDPMIVFDDVDVERTVNGALWGGFANSGQTCTSVERLYVQAGIYDTFVQELRAKAAKLTNFDCVTGPDEGNVDVGYMTTSFQAEKVEAQIAEAQAKGAKISGPCKRQGTARILQPCIVEGADKSMEVLAEETFGPVIIVDKFRDEAEAIAKANDSQYGLSASVWTADLARAERVARAIETGNVSVNNVLSTQAHAGLPFGGAKDSGIGRFKGEIGLHAFSNIKSIMIEKQSAKIEANWYPYTKEKYAVANKMVDKVFDDGILNFVQGLLAGLKLEGLAKKQKL